MQYLGTVTVIVVNLELFGDKIVVMKLNEYKEDTEDIN